MPDNLSVQKLLTGKPIVCTRCMHGHAVDVITGRENAPTEYHCGFCGNYAIVGVPVRFPFMEVTKDTTRPEERKTAPDHNERGSSPMQVGESLKPKKEKKVMAKKKCEAPGCDKKSWMKGLCHKHYVDKYGEYVPEKKGNGVVVEKAENRPSLAEPSLLLTDEMVGFSLSLPIHVFELLETMAKAEYRTPELHAAYLIDKGVRGS